MNVLRVAVVTAFLAVSLFSHISAFAASDQEIEALREEIQAMKSEYEKRILKMEEKLAEMKAEASQPKTTYSKSKDKDFPSRAIYNRAFNPSIGVILGGRFASFSSDEDEIPGFALGHEGERGAEGLSLGETELNFSTSVDDKFYASTTSALADQGDGVEVELEEAYVETLPGLGLPTGATIRMGRAFWTLGYLNEHHSHADDFADRPLPYRAFLDKAFNDTGAQISYVFPTDLYIEAGGGIFRGDDFPFAGAGGSDINSFSAFLRVGGDLGQNSSWRIGGYVLDGEASGRGGGTDTKKTTMDTVMKKWMEKRTKRTLKSFSPLARSRVIRDSTRLISVTCGCQMETPVRRSCFFRASISDAMKKGVTPLWKETKFAKNISMEEAMAGIPKAFSSSHRNGESALVIRNSTLLKIQELNTIPMRWQSWATGQTVSFPACAFNTTTRNWEKISVTTRFCSST